MIDLPEHLTRELLEGRRWIAAELPPIHPKNRAWVWLSMGHYLFGRGALKNPDAPSFTLLRFEIAREIVEDDTHCLYEPDYFEHYERLETQDMYEAIKKAVEYEPDWSKWGSRDKHPVCP